MESRVPSILLGIHREDQKKLLSEYDLLIEQGFEHIHVCDKDDRYLIEFPCLFDWIASPRPENLRLNDASFFLCDPDGNKIGTLSREKQELIRVGEDHTFEGPYVNRGYYVQYNYIYINTGDSCLPSIKRQDFQRMLDKGRTIPLSGVGGEIFGYRKWTYRPMIIDMYKKGYIDLSPEQILEWEIKNDLGL